MRLKYRYIAIFMALFVAMPSMARPRLVVNIVVGGLRQGDIARYEKNFCKDGFLRLRDEGVEFTDCYANYAPTTSEAGIATFATGATPSIHGIFSSVRYDRTSNKAVDFLSKSVSSQIDAVRKEVKTNYSTQSFVAQTLSEAILSSSPRCRAITIAHNPVSAMILAGRKGECYWLSKCGKWSSADCYMQELPLWVRTCNNDDMNRVFATDVWYGRYTRDRYYNSRSSDIAIYEKDNAKRPSLQRKTSDGWVNNLLQMPSGNLAIFEFAKRAISSLLPLHVTEECKVLNVCLDVPRNIAERYGVDSIEYEDMLYSLDALLAEFLTFVYAQLPSRDGVFVTLTSDGGVSPTVEDNSDAMRFNTRQFEVIMNAFLSARYGQDNWVIGYVDGSLYLDHDVIYRHKKSLVDVQNEVASFALQFRGVANAVTATAMRSAQFSQGALSLLQQGYHPRRSGDVLILLEPERIELDSSRVAMSGSTYSYDRHVPLFMVGGDLKPSCVVQRVSTEQIAPTIAAIVGIERPQCSDAENLMVYLK